MCPQWQGSKNRRAFFVARDIHTARLGRIDIGHLADIHLCIGT